MPIKKILDVGRWNLLEVRLNATKTLQRVNPGILGNFYPYPCVVSALLNQQFNGEPKPVSVTHVG